MSNDKEEQIKSEIRPPTLIEKQEVGPPDEPKIGPGVDLNSDITPITRKKIEQIDSSKWDDMSLDQLHQQLSVLEQRMLFAQQYSHLDMITQIERGINQLRALLLKMSPDGIKLM